MAQRPRPRRRQLLRLVLVKRNTSLVGRTTSKHENRTEAVGLLEQPPRSCARPRPAHPPKKSAPWEQARLFPRPRSGSADGDGGGELGYLGRRPLHGDSDRWDPGRSLATSPCAGEGSCPPARLGLEVPDFAGGQVSEADCGGRFAEPPARWRGILLGLFHVFALASESPGLLRLRANQLKIGYGPSGRDRRWMRLLDGLCAPGRGPAREQLPSGTGWQGRAAALPSGPGRARTRRAVRPP